MRYASLAAAVIIGCSFTPRVLTQEGAKPHLNIAVIGHDGHGRSTLTAAITKVLHARDSRNRELSIDEITNPPEQKARGIAISAAHAEFSTSSRHYALTDAATHRDLVKGVLTGAIQMDGAILVVSAADGPMPQTRDAIQLAKQAGVPQIVVYLNKIDLVEDAELRDLVILEIRELLNAHGYSDDDIPVIAGSALASLKGDGQSQASIDRLMAAVDKHFSVPVADREKPFLMAVEDVFSITGRGTVVTGRVQQGALAVGEEVEIVGLGPTRKTKATGVEMFRKLLDRAETGDNVGVLMAGIEKDDVERGQVLAAPGSIISARKFRAALYLLTRYEGGRATPVFPGYRPQFYFRTTDVTGVLSLPDGAQMVMPGDHVTIEVELTTAVALEKGTRFALREGGRTVGAGIVTELPNTGPTEKP